MRTHVFLVVSVAVALGCAAPSPEDETDTSNYQAAYWHFGSTEDSPQRSLARFSAGFERYTSGALIVTLDTALDRFHLGPPYLTSRTDSIMVRGLGKTERFANDCRVGTQPRDARLLGVVRDSTPLLWTVPRLAWTIDSVAAKFRPIRTDSLLCSLRENPD